MHSRSLETFVLDHVKDEQLPETIAISDKFPIRQILDNCPVVVVAPDSPQEPLPFNDPEPYADKSANSDYELKQLSEVHQRSFEIIHPSLGESWQDDYGNNYSAINIKGNNFSKPAVIETSTATDRLIAYGLQESQVIRRVLRASRILRENKIGTEYIIGLAEPQIYPWPKTDSYTDFSEDISLPEYKRRLVEGYWQELPEEKRTAEALVEASQKFEKMTFYISMRAMDTSYRLSDLRVENAKREIFARANKNLASDEQAYDYHDLTANRRYIERHFIPTAAINFAKLHLLGLAHRFPNSQNMTVGGSIVDLDSMHGEPLDLDDDSIKTTDIINDLVEIIMAINSASMDVLSGNKASDQFVASYVRAISDQTDQSTALKYLANLSRMAAAVLEQGRDYDPTTMYLNETSSITDNLNRVLVEDFFTEETGLLAETLKLWFQDNVHVLKDKLEARFAADIQTFIRIIFDECFNDMSIDSMNADSLIDHIFENKLGVVWDWMQIDFAEELINSFIDKFDTELADEPGFVKLKELDNDTKNTILAILVWKALAKDVIYDITAGSEAVFGPMMKQLVKTHWQLNVAEPLLPDTRPELSFRTSECIVLLQTSNIDGEELVDYLKNSEEEIIVQDRQAEEPVISGIYQATSDESVLVETITDGYIEGYSYGDELPVRTIEYAARHNQYVLFVEQTIDGNRRLVLHLNDQSDLAELQQASRDELIQILAHKLDRIETPPSHLFDPDDYTVITADHIGKMIAEGMLKF